jgi:uncharacterized protein (DUF433 family)
MFPMTAFTADTVSRLTGLSVPQLHRWDRSGFFAPSFADPDRRRPYSRIYSFVDVVGLRTIAELRERGIPLSELKKVRAFFATHTNEDWANRRFYVVGRRLFFSHDAAVVAARPLGQQVECAILDLGPIASDLDAAVRRLADRTADEIGRVSRDRFIMGGAPVLAGTRIPTATVDWFYRNGYDTDGIIREFPRLTPNDVAAAVRFERTKREGEPAPLRAAG